MHLFKIILFLILPILGIAQKKLTEMTSNGINLNFDNAILNDSIYPFQKATTFSTGEYNFTKDKYKIEFEPKEDIYPNQIKKYLDSDELIDQEKINFIKDCLNYEKRDIFNFIESRTIEYWKTNKEARGLIEKYFLDIIDLNKVNSSRYNSFKIKHDYPESYEIIKDHFNNRKQIETSPIYEGEMLYFLARRGYLKETLKYLEILFEDLKNNRIKYVNLGKGWGHPEEYEDNIFSYLLKSESSEIRKKAVDLLSNFIAFGGNYEFNLSRTLSSYDFDVFKKYRYQKFNTNKEIDFSKINIESLNDEEDLYNSLPNSRTYFNDLTNDARNIGKYYGLEIWKEYIKNQRIWKILGPNREFTQALILENVIHDEKISPQEKKNMFYSLKFSKSRFFTDYEKLSIVKLIKNIFPDLILNKLQFDQIGLDSFLKYSRPLNLDIDIEDKNAVVDHDFDINHLNLVLQDLNKIGEGLNFKKTTFSNYEMQNYAYTVTSCIFHYFTVNNDLIWIDNEYFSGNYIQIFQNQFVPILRKFGIRNIELSQDSKVLSDETKFDLYIKGNGLTYYHTYSASNLKWFEPTRLSKLINLVLIDNKEKCRFIQVYTGDQTSVFVFAEPEKLKPVLEKYNIDCWAIKEADF